MSFSDSSDEHKKVNDWLRILGDRVRLSLKLDEEGLCAVGHLSGIDCALEVPEGCGKLYLRAPLLPLGTNSEAALRFCMSKHFLGVSTGGAIFAIDPQDDMIVLWQARDLEGLELETFAVLLIDFFEAAQHWKDELQTLPPSQVIPSSEMNRFNLIAMRA